VDNGIQAPDSIDLFGNVQDLPDAGEVTHYDAVSTVHPELGVGCPLLVAGMQHNPVSLFSKKEGCHQAKTVSGSSDEDAGHSDLPNQSIGLHIGDNGALMVDHFGRFVYIRQPRTQTRMLNPELTALLDLTGSVAIVTGGARGIGFGISRTLAAAGARVVIGDKALSPEARNDIGGLTGAEALELDVSSEESVEQFMAAVLKRFGRLDILVNNAGVYRFSPLREEDLSEWDRTININLRGAYLCLRRAGAIMRAAREGGRIINVSSLNTRSTYVGMAHYDASKGGLEALTRAAALEFATAQITCNAVAPGGVFTQGSLAFRPVAGFPATKEADDEYGRQLPLGRNATPEDVGQAVWFLASRAAAYITGQTILVDGGVTLGASPRQPPASSAG
jgi:2-deoxy-D-gluconate 3-dehydrogenase